MKLKKGRAPLACVIVGALMFAACGSDDSDGSSATDDTSVATTAPDATVSSEGAAVTAGGDSGAAAATGDPIVVGMICACTGVFASTFGQSGDVTQAWVDALNASGGINGHPVEVVIKDDENDPAKALLAVKELVEEDEVVAIVGDFTSTSGSWADYITEKGVPVIGFPATQPAATNANWFPIGPSVQELWGALSALVAADGKTQVGFPYCAEAPICAQVVDILGAYGEPLGLGLTSEAVAASQTSFTAPCLTMKDDGVDALLLGLDPDTGARFLDECTRQGLDAKLYNIGSAYDESWLSTKAMDGVVLVSFLANHLDTSIPGVQDFQDDLASYSDLDPRELNLNEFGAWVAGELFETAAKAANLGPESTPADVTAALHALRDETVRGATVPLTFVDGKPTVLTCHFGMSLQGGELVSNDNGQPTCLTPELAAIAEQLAQG